MMGGKNDLMSYSAADPSKSCRVPDNHKISGSRNILKKGKGGGGVFGGNPLKKQSERDTKENQKLNCTRASKCGNETCNNSTLAQKWIWLIGYMLIA